MRDKEMENPEQCEHLFPKQPRKSPRPYLRNRLLLKFELDKSPPYSILLVIPLNSFEHKSPKLDKSLVSPRKTDQRFRLGQRANAILSMLQSKFALVG
jgi:hypothetical protein